MVPTHASLFLGLSLATYRALCFLTQTYDCTCARRTSARTGGRKEGRNERTKGWREDYYKYARIYSSRTKLKVPHEKNRGFCAPEAEPSEPPKLAERFEHHPPLYLPGVAQSKTCGKPRCTVALRTVALRKQAKKKLHHLTLYRGVLEPVLPPRARLWR